MTPAAVDRLDHLQRRLLLTGGVAAGLCALGWLLNDAQFFRSYLLGFVLWHGVAIGGLALLLLQYILPGNWAWETRPLMQAIANTLPVTALLFVPLALGVDRVYVWTDAPPGDELLASKAAYLNRPFFLARAAGYFVIWSLLAWWTQAWTPETGGPRDSSRGLRRLSAVGLVAVAITVTFAAIDWLMSIEPHWYSSIFPLVAAAGNVVSALAVIVLSALALNQLDPQASLSEKTSADLGSVMLAVVMVWAYLGISQFLLIWAANLPEEAGWFLHRLDHGWQWVASAIVLFHFAVPFLLLMSRELRSNLRALAAIAGLLLAMRFVDLLWTIAPTFHPDGFFIHWLDLAAPLAVGGLWLTALIWQLRRQRQPLLNQRAAVVQQPTGATP